MINSVRAVDRRRVETPNATMTTLASPSLGPTATLSLWEVEMASGAIGPLHTIDREQVWALVEGRATVEVGDEAVDLRAGDTLVLEPSIPRRVHATEDARFLVCGRSDAEARVVGEERSRGVPAWIA